eukprot:NODE_361_length_1851_cov_72.371809_g303_i0.p1 GENE.NODE_361_length_1851_cov_72.371809_g303_i0~~NODE_361_length_1851_cov_72.371809_g303_i0.p1  ORF type:complete len:551 (-),score=182.04 NODE_361_length_1851_cov_72.371809_g303_i0:89-1741(-)
MLVRDSHRQVFVAKELDQKQMSKKDKLAADHEVGMISGMSHPFIVKFVDCFVEPGLRMHILMEYADGGDLGARVKTQRGKRVPFPEEQIMLWFAQLCLALDYLHGRKILHRDLKCQNVFLTSGGMVKLGDFGFSKRLKTAFMAHTVCGTPYYFSPELCQGNPYSNKSDIWSLGIILYELCSLSRPYEAQSLQELMTKITHGRHSPLPSTVPAKLSRLVSCLLLKVDTQRPSLPRILRAGYVQSYVKRLPGLLRVVLPEQRYPTVVREEPVPVPVPVPAGKPKPKPRAKSPYQAKPSPKGRPVLQQQRQTSPRPRSPVVSAQESEAQRLQAERAQLDADKAKFDEELSQLRAEQEALREERVVLEMEREELRREVEQARAEAERRIQENDRLPLAQSQAATEAEVNALCDQIEVLPEAEGDEIQESPRSPAVGHDVEQEDEYDSDFEDTPALDASIGGGARGRLEGRLGHERMEKACRTLQEMLMDCEQEADEEGTRQALEGVLSAEEMALVPQLMELVIREQRSRLNEPAWSSKQRVSSVVPQTTINECA